MCPEIILLNVKGLKTKIREATNEAKLFFKILLNNLNEDQPAKTKKTIRINLEIKIPPNPRKDKLPRTILSR